MANPTKEPLLLTDVVPQLDDKGEAEPIGVLLEYQDKAPFGIIMTPVGQEYNEYRLVVENHHGKLMVHIWATLESCGQDPTHSIEIERRE